MESMESLWKIESPNINMDPLPEDDIVDTQGLPSFFTISLAEVQQDSAVLSQLSEEEDKEEEIVLEDIVQPRTGVKRRYDEDLNSSVIDESKLVVVTEGTPAPSNYPCLQDYPGPYNFSASFTQLSESAKNKHWAFSQRLKKLYIVMDHWIQVQFRAPPGFYVRALPVYTQPSDINKPVKRCPNHSSLTHTTNLNFMFREHLIRVAGEDTSYQEDTSTGRLSVVFPVEAPAPGSDLIIRQMKFMCLSSDIGGICRRPVKMVLTLEDRDGLVFGREVFDLRLCSCPKRDKNQDEERYQKEEDRIRHSERLDCSQTKSSPPGKKVIKAKDSKYLMIPVRIEDYKSIDSLVQQLTESREIQNNPLKPHAEVIQAVKDERIKLQIEHNPQIVNLLFEMKKKTGK